jgi:hypothetical protein
MRMSEWRRRLGEQHDITKHFNDLLNMFNSRAQFSISFYISVLISVKLFLCLSLLKSKCQNRNRTEAVDKTET